MCHVHVPRACKACVISCMQRRWLTSHGSLLNSAWNACHGTSHRSKLTSSTQAGHAPSAAAVPVAEAGAAMHLRHAPAAGPGAGAVTSGCRRGRIATQQLPPRDASRARHLIISDEASDPALADPCGWHAECPARWLRLPVCGKAHPARLGGMQRRAARAPDPDRLAQLPRGFMRARGSCTVVCLSYQWPIQLASWLGPRCLSCA